MFGWIPESSVLATGGIIHLHLRIPDSLSPGFQGRSPWLFLGATFVVFMFNEPDPRGRYGDALFAVLGIGIGLQRFGVSRKNGHAFRFLRR